MDNIARGVRSRDQYSTRRSQVLYCVSRPHIQHCSHQTVLYESYSTAKSFVPPTQNTINIYTVLHYIHYIYLLCYSQNFEEF